LPNLRLVAALFAVTRKALLGTNGQFIVAAMARDSYLLHPQVMGSAPFGNSVTARLLNKRVDETLIDDPMNDPSITVAVRSYNEAAKLEKLLEDVQRQAYKSELEVIVIDNASSDRTAEVVERFGARLVTLPKGEFTYPKSMNLAMESASNDVVFLTVAHARLSNVHSLHAGARHFAKDARVAGVFGKVLPNEGASYLERWVATIDNNLGLAKPAQRISKAGMGALAGTGAMLSKSVWEELGRFDQRYETGGEDTALAKSMLKNGYGIVLEPALTVHHSHGLGFRDSVKQELHQFQTVRAPQQFDRQELLERRPDLRANG
jgi:cellulose synthase/poly-beta-1,6-N-acetylglucosamine synthase-like glycosyltransferase